MTNIRHRDDICFGPFRLLPTERLLERDGARLAIGGRAFDVLIALIERGGEVVGHRELPEAGSPSYGTPPRTTAHLAARRAPV